MARRAGSQPASQERRKAPRAAIELVIQYSNLEHFCQDYARNLSLGGIFIETRQPLEIGATLELSFQLPGFCGEIKSTARVVRRVTEADVAGTGQRPGMAVQFEDLPEETKEVIDVLVRRALELD